MIAIDQKNNVKFTSAESIPDGAAAIIFKKPKGVKIDEKNMGKNSKKKSKFQKFKLLAGQLSFHTFAMADGDGFAKFNP